MMEIPESWRSTQEEQTQQETLYVQEYSNPVVQLMGNFVFIGVGVPLATFIIMMPLFIQTLPTEVWLSYYWSLQYLVALVFAELTVRECLDHEVSAKRLILGWSCLVSVNLCVSTLGRVGFGEAFISFSLFLLNLILPIILRLLDCRSRIIPCRILLLQGFGWFLGSLPTLISASLYIIVERMLWLERKKTILLVTFLWALAPVAVRPFGTLIWVHASPAAKLFGPMLWRFYCDMAFATLGLAIFMKTPEAAAANIVSTVCLLIVLALRGRPEVFQVAVWLRMKDPEDLRTWRIFAFFDVLSLLIARTAAYTIYLCMVTTQLLLGDDVPFHQRPYLHVPGISGYSAQIYRNMDPEGTDIAVAVACVSATWIAFGCFYWLVPAIWTVRTGHTTDPKAEVVGKTTSEMSTTPFPCAGDVLAPSRPPMWCWSPGTVDRYGVASAQKKQAEMLGRFLSQHRYVLCAMLAFQVGVTMSSVTFAQHFLRTPS